MQIILIHPDNAPNFCFEIQEVGNPARNVFVQSDWDYPGIASTFGWSILVRPKQLDDMELDNLPPDELKQYHKQCDCPHDATDGTVDCRQCGMKAGEFIASAYDYLASNEGKIVDDPGYFESEAENVA